MRIIESTKNELVIRYAKLLQKKYRDEEKLFIIEGKKNAYDSLKNLSLDEIEAVLICKNDAEDFLSEFAFLEQKLIAVDQKILSKISDYSSNSEIVVIAKQRDYSKKIECNMCLYLDRIRDPGNLGTIIRTAAAAGYAVLLDSCCDLFNPKVIRGCMSAIFNVQGMYANTDILNGYKSRGYKIYGADANGKNIFGFDNSSVSSPIIIAIGNEAEGLSNEVVSLCDELIAIPIEGIESLNAAQAAGILMFEYKHRIAKI